jgi:hypothetical protein
VTLSAFWSDPTSQSLALIVLGFVVFARLSYCDFVNYDDPDYVYANPHVAGGLSWANFIWAFTTLNGGISYWHPLTWLSHQLDCTSFGLRPGAHHLTNVWLHLGSSVVLLHLLAQFRLGPKAAFFIAAMFVVHPLHVESVAWIAERKDVLYGLFWLCALAAYMRYRCRGQRRHYVWALVWFAAALMSKPTAVTLPAVLLGLELTLFRGEAMAQQVTRLETGRLVVLLAPFVCLAAISAALTIVAQHALHALPGLADIPLDDRLDTSLIGVELYGQRALWPTGLAVSYLPTQARGFGEFLGAAGSIGCAAIFCWRWRKRAPLAGFGFAWFVLTLLPNIGLVQAGPQCMADRYMYIPLIGLMLAAVARARTVWPRLERSGFATGLGLGLVTICAVLSLLQLRYWRNGTALFQRAVDLDSRNWVARLGLGMALTQEQRYPEALRELNAALGLPGNRFETEWRLGVCYQAQGEFDQAAAHFRAADALRPGTPRIRELLDECVARLCTGG